MRDFSQLFEVIYDKFISLQSGRGEKASIRAFGLFLGHGHDGRVKAWRGGQWPAAEDCWKIEQKLGFSLRWLVTGEGKPFDEAIAATSVNHSPSPLGTPIPLIGFASCSTFGWHGTMTIPVSVEPPAWHEGMVAVMASGESMLPAGIGHGQVCYCDTTKVPCSGEAVYVEQEDGSGTIKMYLGRGVIEGGTPCVNLQGWFDREKPDGPQKPFFLDVATDAVRKLAPVIYVRRRL